jgi:hypothetical protein
VPGRPGHAWLKVKHRHREVLGVAGWRPSTPGRPGGLIVTDGEHPVGVATLALPAAEKEALLGLIRRCGRCHPTGTITVPEGCLEAVVEYTSRTLSGHPARSNRRRGSTADHRQEGYKGVNSAAGST